MAVLRVEQSENDSQGGCEKYKEHSRQRGGCTLELPERLTGQRPYGCADLIPRMELAKAWSAPLGSSDEEANVSSHVAQSRFASTSSAEYGRTENGYGNCNKDFQRCVRRHL